MARTEVVQRSRSQELVARYGPGPEIRAARFAGSVLGALLGGVVRWLVLPTLRSLRRFVGRFPKLSAAIVGLGVAWAVGGWVYVAALVAVMVSLVWLALTGWPEAIRDVVSLVGGTGRNRPPLAAEQPTVTTASRRAGDRVSAGEVGGPVGRPEPQMRRVAQDPVTGQDLFVPVVHVPPGLWPDVVDVHPSGDWTTR